MKALIIGMMMILTVPCIAYSTAEEPHILTFSDAEGIIKEYLIKHTPWVEGQINVKNISISNNIVLPKGWDYEIAPAPKSTMIGRTAFSLNISTNGKVAQTSWISADIEVLVDVVLTSRAMKDHQLVSENDIYVGKKDLAELPPGYIYDMRDVIGKRLKRFIGANRPLTVDILEEPPLFRRGDKVFIVAETETLKVTAVGMATGDGYRGRPAKVINMQSRKEVFGEVVDGGTVRVKW